MKSNTPTLDDITAGLNTAYFLSVGDSVTSQENNEDGEVLGFSQEGNPVVLFDSGERTVDLNKETLILKKAQLRFNALKQEKNINRIPLKHAESLGFKQAFNDTYYYDGAVEKQAEKYPWAVDSVWKVISEDGNQFLVREGDLPGEPADRTTKHQLDNAGPQAGGEFEENFNIFD